MANVSSRSDAESPFQKPASVLAYRYAEAFRASVSSDKKVSSKKLAEVSDQLNALSSIYQENTVFQELVHSAVISQKDKLSAIAQLAAKANLKAVAPLLTLLVKNNRLPLVPEIILAFHDLNDKAAGLTPVDIVTAHALSKASQAEITAAIEAAMKQKNARKIASVFRVDPSLVGGLVVQVGSKVFDLSIKGRLERLQSSIAERG